jgi:hypothetical protein
MVHGQSTEQCEEVLAAISRATGCTEYISLYSTHEYKKTRLHFYTDAYEQWEMKYLPQGEVARAT